MICTASLMVCTNSCKKENNAQTGEMMTIGASIAHSEVDQAKTGLNPNGSNFDVVWSALDEIKLFAGTTGETFCLATGVGSTEASFRGTKPGDAPFYGFYPATGCTCTGEGQFSYTILPSSTYSSTVENAGPMAGISSQDGTTLAFRNAMSWLNIGFIGDDPDVNPTTIMKVELTDLNGTTLSGTLNVTVNSDNTLTSTLTGSNPTLTIESATGVVLSDEVPTYFRFLVPAGAFVGTDKVQIKVYTQSSLPKTFTETFPGTDGVAANKVYTAPILTPIKSPGFSVSSDLKVFLSSGNLQYNPSLDQWRFAPNQWDRFDNDITIHKFDVTAYSATGTSWIDLFAWGTSNYAHGAITYQPWVMDGLSNTNYKAYGDINKDLDQTGESGQADWGYGRTFNGTADWRTLKYAEWDYMLNTRTNWALLKSTGNINGVNGAILLPDDWVLPSGMTFVPGAYNYTVNSYTLAQWAIMESAGAAFLPAAGSIDANTTEGEITNVNNWGWYWSTTHDGQTANNGPYPNFYFAAGGLVIIPNSVFMAMGCDRSDGYSVRLARNVPKPN